MPTLLDCAGLPIPETMEGVSVLPLARGEKPQWRKYLHGEHTMSLGHGRNGQSIHWITDKHMKYVWFSGTGHEQLFDLKHDPQELHDIAPEPSSSDTLTRLRRELIEELTGREEGFTDGQQLIAGRPVAPCLAFLRQRQEISEPGGRA